MEQNVHFVTVAARDLDAARAFYVHGLGWTPLVDVPGEILFFTIAPGAVLGLFDAEAFNRDLGLPGSADPSGVTLAYNVDSPDAVRATVEEMTAAGGAVLTPPEPGAFGGVFHAHVADPNGLIWEIAHNPGWRIEADGSVTLG